MEKDFINISFDLKTVLDGLMYHCDFDTGHVVDLVKKGTRDLFLHPGGKIEAPSTHTLDGRFVLMISYGYDLSKEVIDGSLWIYINQPLRN